MNLEESNSFVEEMEKNNKNKKTVLTTIIICAILVVLLVVLICYLKYQDSLKLKMYIDGKQVKISSNLFVQDEGTDYINIMQLSNMLGYSYQKGEYKSYTEDQDSCYIRTPYEIASMKAESQSLTKYIINENAKNVSQKDNETNTTTNNTVANTQLITTDNTTGEQTVNIVVNSKNETPETFYLEKPIKYINNELYVPFSEVQRIFNVKLDISETNRIKVYSLNYLIQYATQLATNLKYSVVSNTYENLTAMADDMLVVGDGKNYGVVSLSTGQEIISLKYEDIVYMQNTKEFLVTAEGSVGIVSNEGKTIIKPTEYDNISVLDELEKLYLVEKNDKYGVVNGDGDTIIFNEYDAIGLENPEEFKNEDIRNYNLLFDSCIPVKSDGKYGIIDTNGEEKLKCVYDSLGYVPGKNVVTDEENNSTKDAETKEKNEYSGILIIPESVGIKGIIVCYNGLYGIFDANVKRLIIPCAYTKIYSKTKSGIITYYLEYNGEEIELENYLEENDLKSVTSENKEENNTDEQTEENQNTDEINVEEEEQDSVEE